MKYQRGSTGLGCLGLLVALATGVLTVVLAVALFASGSSLRSMGLNPAIGGVLGLIVLAIGGITALGLAGWGLGRFKKR